MNRRLRRCRSPRARPRAAGREGVRSASPRSGEPHEHHERAGHPGAPARRFRAQLRDELASVLGERPRLRERPRASHRAGAP